MQGPYPAVRAYQRQYVNTRTKGEEDFINKNFLVKKDTADGASPFCRECDGVRTWEDSVNHLGFWFCSPIRKVDQKNTKV
jgi:hypothetical protein